MEFHRLSDEKYAKLKGQTRLQFGAILGVFNMYGMDVYVKGAIEELMMVTEETWDVIRGKDKPINVEILRKARRSK